MRLGYWENPHRKGDVRIYINDVPEMGPKGRAFLSPSGATAKLSVTPKGAYQAVLDAMVMDQVIPSAEAIATVSFDHFLALTPRPSAPANMRKTRSAKAPRPERRIDEANQLNLATIKVPDPVILRIDHREPDELFAAFDGLPNVTVERVELPVGDIEINGQIVVERKSCFGSGSNKTGRTDFEESVIGGRLFFQSDKMRHVEGIIPVVLLEGEPHEEAHSLIIKNVDGMISYLVAVQRLSVITTYSLHHTAYVLLKMATHHQSGLGYEPPLRGKKSRDPKAKLAFVLEGLPGISSNMAKRLAEHFGSLKSLVLATDDDLLAIKGLGPKTIDQIRSVIDGD